MQLSKCYVKRYFSNNNRIVTILYNRISIRGLNFAVCFLDSDVNLISRGRSSVSKPLIVLQQSIARCIEIRINTASFQFKRIDDSLIRFNCNAQLKISIPTFFANFELCNSNAMCDVIQPRRSYSLSYLRS